LKMWRWLYRIGVGVVVAGAVTHALLGRYFVQTRPHAPDLSVGAIYYYKGVNGVVYLTGAEHNLISGLWISSCLSALFCLVYVLYGERRNRR
jgi:hypothetical protein